MRALSPRLYAAPRPPTASVFPRLSLRATPQPRAPRSLRIPAPQLFPRFGSSQSVNTVNSTLSGGAISSQGTDGPAAALVEVPVLNQKMQPRFGSSQGLNTVNSTVSRGGPRSQRRDGEPSAFADAPVLNPKTQGVPTDACVSRVSVPPWRTRNATHAQAVTPSPARIPRRTGIAPTCTLGCGSNPLPASLRSPALPVAPAFPRLSLRVSPQPSASAFSEVWQLARSQHRQLHGQQRRAQVATTRR